MSQVITNKATNPYEQLVGVITQQTGVSKEDQEMLMRCNDIDTDDPNMDDLFVAQYENDPAKIRDAKSELQRLSQKHALWANICRVTGLVSVLPVFAAFMLGAAALFGESNFFLNHLVLMGSLGGGGMVSLMTNAISVDYHDNKADKYKRY